MTVPTATTGTLIDVTTGAACVVTEVDVQAEVVALDATVRLTQRFHNPLPTAVEAVYVFPLAPLAAVTSMRATLGGRTVHARLRERGQARREYAEAVAAGRRAALAEEDRPSTFTMTVGNLAGGEDAEIVLDLVGPVEVHARLDPAGVVEAWEAALRLPTVVAPRYTEGQPIGGADVGSGTASDTDRVPDASRVTPPVGVGVGPALAWQVRLDPAGLPVGALGAPDGADRTPQPDGSVVVAGGGRCDTDVTVRWELAPSTVAVAATVQPDTPGSEGREGDATVAVTIVPPVGTRARRPADIVIALDRSGSMDGWKMGTAIRAARRLLDSLASTDRVGLVAFDTVVEGPELGLLPLSGANRERLHERLAEVHARGGTELTDAVVAAGHLLGRHTGERERLVLLVTDAQVSGEQQAVAAAQATGARFVVVGVDTAVNHGLLQRLGSATGGSATAVASPGELDSAVEIARRRLGAPTLEHLRVGVAGGIAGSLAGDHGDVVWPDSVARLGLRLMLPSTGVCRVRLDADGPSGPFVRELDATAPASEAGRLTWARARLRALEDDFDGGGQTEPADLVALSLAHGVLCRFTAFVAVDAHGDTVGDGTPPPTLVQPSELPQGWAAGGPKMASLAAPMASPPPGMQARPAARPSAVDHSIGYESFGPASAPPARTEAAFWRARPARRRAPQPGSGDLAALVGRLRAAIASHGGHHALTRAALEDLLEALGRAGLSARARSLVQDLVAAGADVALDNDELVLRETRGQEVVCRIDLRTGAAGVAGGALAPLTPTLARAAVERLAALQAAGA